MRNANLKENIVIPELYHPLPMKTLQNEFLKKPLVQTLLKKC